MYVRSMGVMLAMAFAVGLAPGCGDDGSVLEAIYEVDTWTRNDASCDAEGDDVLAGQSSTTFYIKQENLLGVKFLNLNFCDDVTDCESLAGDSDTIHLGMYAFDQGGDGDGWRADNFFGFSDMGVCDGTYSALVLTGDGDTVRLEARDTPAAGFSEDSDGFCDAGDAKQAAQGNACEQLEVFTATRVADLP